MQTTKTIRRVIWRRILDDHSFEECVVTATPVGFGIVGDVIAAQEGTPLTVRYDITCDRSWSARSVAIEQRLGDTQRHTRLERAGESWLVDGVHDARLDGCTEPDLGVTPSTNALAIRRLDLGFTALVAVDALGLPVHYESIWTRIADWQGDGS